MNKDDFFKSEKTFLKTACYYIITYLLNIKPKDEFFIQQVVL
jgi:hypothetical protein